jgi:hypothetical protein
MKYRNQLFSVSVIILFSAVSFSQEYQSPLASPMNDKCEIVGSRNGTSGSAEIRMTPVPNKMSIYMNQQNRPYRIFFYDFTEKVDFSSQEAFDSSLKNNGEEVIQKLKEAHVCWTGNTEPPQMKTMPDDSSNPLVYGHCSILPSGKEVFPSSPLGHSSCAGNYSLAFDGVSVPFCLSSDLSGSEYQMRYEHRGYCLQEVDKTPLALPRKAACTIIGGDEVSIKATDGTEFIGDFDEITPGFIQTRASGDARDARWATEGKQILAALHALDICE